MSQSYPPSVIEATQRANEAERARRAAKLAKAAPEPAYEEPELFPELDELEATIEEENETDGDDG